MIGRELHRAPVILLHPSCLWHRPNDAIGLNNSPSTCTFKIRHGYCTLSLSCSFSLSLDSTVMVDPAILTCVCPDKTSPPLTNCAGSVEDVDSWATTMAHMLFPNLRTALWNRMEQLVTFIVGISDYCNVIFNPFG